MTEPRTRNGYWRLKLTSRRDRFTAKLKGLHKFLKEQPNAPNTTEVLRMVVSVLRGWINYHGISDNDKRVKGFIQASKRILLACFNRRSRKYPMMSWDTLSRILKAIKFPEQWKTVSSSAIRWVYSHTGPIRPHHVGYSEF